MPALPAFPVPISHAYVHACLLDLSFMPASPITPCLRPYMPSRPNLMPCRHAHPFCMAHAYLASLPPCMLPRPTLHDSLPTSALLACPMPTFSYACHPGLPSMLRPHACPFCLPPCLPPMPTPIHSLCAYCQCIAHDSPS